MPQVQQVRTIQLATQTLAQDGATALIKLSSQGAWRALRLRLTATTTGGTPSGLSRYEGWGVISRIRLRANSAVIWDLIPGEMYKKNIYLQGCRAERVAASTTPGAWSYSLEIPFVLPFPFRFPQSHTTMFPAGVCANLELEVTVAASRIGGLYGTVSTTSFSVDPQLTVQAVQLDVSNAELAALIKSDKLACMELHSVSQQVTATGQVELPLLTGSGVMIGFYASHADATVLAFDDAMVTQLELVSGTNDFLLNSRHFEIQNEARELMRVPDPVIFTGLNGAGSWHHSFAKNGMIGEGVDLNGLQQLRYRPTVAALTNTIGRIEVIQDIYRPSFYRQVANL